MDTSGKHFKIIHCFCGKDGANPATALTLDDSGVLFGATAYGGAHGSGTIFHLNPGGSQFQVLAHMEKSQGRSPCPSGNLVRLGRTLVGILPDGGDRGEGALFSVDTVTGVVGILHSFHADVDGANPWGRLVFDAPTGSLYGSCQQGGAFGMGTVYRHSLLDSTTSTLHSFAGGRLKDGERPVDGLLGSSGERRLYGTTAAGGPGNHGSVFSLDLPPERQDGSSG
jgi:uncharacterized repeat protein (TIGR03803 family)